MKRAGSEVSTDELVRLLTSFNCAARGTPLNRGGCGTVIVRGVWENICFMYYRTGYVHVSVHVPPVLATSDQ